MIIKTTTAGYRFSTYSFPTHNLDIFYCLVDSDNNVISNISSCKDYMGDVIYQSQVSIASQIAISTNRIKFLKTNSLKVVFFFPNTSRRDTFLKNIKIINNIEKKAGINKSVFTKCTIESSPGAIAVLVEADNFWKRSSLICSVYFQIVRTLRLVNSNKRILPSFIDDVLEANVNNRDTTYWNEIVSSKVDIQFLINNIDEIVKEDPLTGVDDVEIKGSGSDGILVSASINGKELSSRIIYSHNNHASHGIRTLASNIRLLKTSNIFTTYGIKWAYKYLLLKGEINE